MSDARFVLTVPISAEHAARDALCGHRAAGGALAGGVLLAVRGCAPGAASLEGGGTAVTGVSAQMSLLSPGDAFVAFDGTYARAYDGRTAELLWERSPDQSDGYSCASSDWLLALYKANSLYVYDTAATWPSPSRRRRRSRASRLGTAAWPCSMRTTPSRSSTARARAWRPSPLRTARSWTLRSIPLPICSTCSCWTPAASCPGPCSTSISRASS